LNVENILILENALEVMINDNLDRLLVIVKTASYLLDDPMYVLSFEKLLSSFYTNMFRNNKAIASAALPLVY